MKNSFLNRRLFFVSCLFIALILSLSNCINSSDKTTITDNRGNAFAGSEACINCHRSVYESFTHTAHFHTSNIADSNTVKGSFKEGNNLFVFGNSVVVMEKSNDSLYQTEYKKSFKNFMPVYEKANSKPFDVVIGSNTKGQSYLYWQGNHFYQLPLSYFTVSHSWCNSPGYPFMAVYNRSVNARCLECHSTYSRLLHQSDSAPDEFDHKQIIYGITCERCHGPAAKHVLYQTQHPESKIARYIVNMSRLTQQQNLDLCALCHSGNSIHNKQPSFSYTAGDTLTNYFTRDTASPDVRSTDVHGNQYGLLLASQCFKQSEGMTCITCHNTHSNERGNTALFSARCQSCHNSSTAHQCALTNQSGKARISSNCIDCHMPLIASKVISVTLPGDTSAKSAFVRSHYIGIYPAEMYKKILLTIGKKS